MAVVVPIISTFDSKGVTKAIADFKKLDGAGNKTQFALGNLNKGMSSLGKTFAKYGGIAAGVTGVIGGTMVKAAYESQKVMKQTEAIITATGGAAGLTAKQVGNLANTMSLKTGIDDEAIQTSMNLLLTFKQVRNEMGAGNDIFNRASMAMLDLGNVFGSSDAAAKMLGKALSDPIKGVTALARAGVNFSQQQKDQIRTLVQTGQTLEAQKLILAEVESQVGGTAVATGTAFDRMRVAIDNVSESFGAVLIPYVEKFANYVIQNVVPIMSRFSNLVGQQGIGAGIKYLSGEFFKATANMGAFGNVVLGLIAGMTALRLVMLAATVAQVAFNVALFANPVGLVVAAVIAFGVALVALAVKFKVVRDVFTQVWNGIVSYFQIQINIALGIYEFFINKFISSVNLIIKAWNAIPFTSKISEINQVNLALDITALKVKGAGKVAAGSAADFRKFEEAGKATAKSLTGSDTGAGGGGVGGAVETVADKFKKFAESARAVVADQKNLRSALKNTADAQKSLQTATNNVATAQAKLNKIANGYGAGSKEATEAQKTLTSAQREATKAGFALADAQSEVLAAQRRIADLNKAADPRTIQEAQDDLTQAQYTLIDAEEELAKARAGGNQRDIVEAEIAVRDATNGVIDANTKLVESQKAADPALLEQAQRDLETAQLNVVEAQDAQKDATDAVDEAQRLLNETISGAAKTSDTYKTALQQLVEAQDAEAEAIDKVRDAKEREIETTRNLAKAEILLRKAKGKLTKKQRAAADRLLGELNTPVTVPSPTPIASPSMPDFSGLDFSSIDWSGFSVGGLATLAEGGIVTRPTFALIGEGGESEAVIPLSKLGGMGGGDVYNITINSKIADASLPDVIVGELRKFNRRSGAINIQVA
jgi:peptidoglycan hydrolase CwlO-like protein